MKLKVFYPHLDYIHENNNNFVNELDFSKEKVEDKKQLRLFPKKTWDEFFHIIYFARLWLENFIPFISIFNFAAIKTFQFKLRRLHTFELFMLCFVSIWKWFNFVAVYERETKETRAFSRKQIEFSAWESCFVVWLKLFPLC